MKARGLLLLCLFLTGCLFTINQPLVGPDGTAAFFLDENGRYNVFSEGGTLHLLKGGELIAVPAATVPELGGVADWAPDGCELLYISTRLESFLQTSSSTLARIAARSDAEPEVVLQSEAIIKDAAFTLDGRVAVLRFAEEPLGTLDLYDPTCDAFERVFDDVLAFRLDPSRTSVVALHVDLEGPVPIGRLARWRLGEQDPEILADFVLGEQMLEIAHVLSDKILLDIDPTGQWAAISLFDQVFIDPQAEEEVPALYLVDTWKRRVERLAEIGFIPVFSPDGTHLAYITSDDGNLGVAIVRNLETEWSVRVPGSEGASTCFWLSNEELGLSFGSEDDTQRISVVNLANGERTDLVE